MDPRIAARRAEVTRASQQSSLQVLARALGLAALLAAGVWFVTSPYVDIDHVALGGAARADVEAVLSEVGVEVGDPLLLVPTGRLVRELESDPWVSSANVARLIPDTLEVSIVERVPILAVESGGSHSVVASDGTVLEVLGERPDHVPVLLDAPRQPPPGQEVVGSPAAAALMFLGEYGPITSLARFEMEDEELWLRLPDHDVRLGRPVDMAAKAASLRAVLAEGPPTGTVIVMIAPERPTLQPQAPPAEPPEESQPELEG